MPHTLSNPDDLHDPTGYGYSHLAATTGDLVFVAGQYGSDHDGHVVSDDFAAQVDRAFANLGVALRAAGLDYRHVARLGTYVVDHDADRLTVLLDRITRIWGDTPPAQTLLGVATLALPGMLFEVDAVAAR
ncbi:RidA family protein [Saccharothrix deserti]|uniref:RidA family protein n=1 Tax=Saccharothrix deserti TaxID=2593674 RepID=UPI00131E4642|nr:Rid family hydrolase [Saccharothrix deserti]